MDSAKYRKILRALNDLMRIKCLSGFKLWCLAFSKTKPQILLS